MSTPDFFLVQEPYIRNCRIEGLPRQWTSWLSGNGKADIISLPSCVSPIFLTSGENTVITKIPNRDKHITLISVYSFPATTLEEMIKELDEALSKLQDENVIIGDDINADCVCWGYRTNNNRGYQVENFIAQKNLQLLNSSGAEPTFQRHNAEGWPDLTLASNPTLANMCDWEVMEYHSFNDHNFIKIIIKSETHIMSYLRFKTKFGGHKKFYNHFSGKIHKLLKIIHNADTIKDLDTATEKIQLEILDYCLHSYKIRKIPTTPNISWWNQSLEIMKKELNALSRRVKKSTGETREHYQKVYSRKRAICKKEILHAKRSAWKKLCSKASSPYGAPYISEKPANPPSVIFNILGNPLTGNAKAFAGKILQQLYPEAAENKLIFHLSFIF
ncbi:hypothetical protein AVEN_73205-1 [Araneus ventricosus]|uniref:Endonuclease/exonuclease/phosphatase domain-containing protein n=1 Tax=Araneus ventricosus TaxID=182803 RepID=A0A4Y2HN83_ARAVE|nr:hypothetical protein AVEN_73205-1 [Araneus ventricosus]